ncbi:MAG TPA: DUF1801 domain-containing protein [Roseiflexaceae bacterium]|nr:DUF1801 domain-containing protein [Roseiflexaceae bacterium]
MNQRHTFSSIDDYLAALDPDVRAIMEQIRAIVQRTVPAAHETISYQMPAFKLKHVFLFFAAFKKHIGIYPPVQATGDLAQALLPYRGAKGNLKFPLNQPMPYDVIERVVVALAQQQS